MNLSKLNIEQLVKYRTKLILEGKSTTEINSMIDKKEQEYVNMLFEDTSATGSPGGAVSGGDVGSMGVAFANNTTAGMGNIIAAQPSSLAGSTIGPNWSDNGGTTGSGDVSFTLGNKPQQKTEMGKNHGARTGKKNRKKKLDIKELRKTFAKKQDYTTGSETKAKRVLNFNDFQKDGFERVTKVKQ
jgi:hypothetical protein